MTQYIPLKEAINLFEQHRIDYYRDNNSILSTEDPFRSSVNNDLVIQTPKAFNIICCKRSS